MTADKRGLVRTSDLDEIACVAAANIHPMLIPGGAADKRATSPKPEPFDAG